LNSYQVLVGFSGAVTVAPYLEVIGLTAVHPSLLKLIVYEFLV
jgi:hypothetical protein